MSQKQDLYVDQGSEYRHTFKYREADKVTPVPLTGLTGRCHVRESVEAEATLYEATTETSGLEITDIANGVIVLTIPGTTTSAWLVEEAVYDIELVDGVQKPFRLVQGRIFLNREVTR